jgi:hypothetical protein
LRAKLAILVVLASVGPALAQQTVTVVPPAFTLPSTRPEYQAFSSCQMSCANVASLCQSSCSAGISPLASLANSTFATTGTRPDPGAQAQCTINCSSQLLACRLGCRPPPY